MMCENIQSLEKISIPHLNPMEWKMRVSGHTTGTTQMACSEAIPTPIHAGGLLAIQPDRPQWKGFMLEEFCKDGMLLA